MKCNCHMCNKEVDSPFWIMDMKFCKDCFYAIEKGNIDYFLKQKYEPIKFDVLITNGYVERDDIYNAIDKGWTFVATIPAKMIHPHAMDTDKATIFTKYNNPEPFLENDLPKKTID